MHAGLRSHPAISASVLLQTSATSTLPLPEWAYHRGLHATSESPDAV
jgi:hypothetical protein